MNGIAIVALGYGLYLLLNSKEAPNVAVPGPGPYNPATPDPNTGGPPMGTVANTTTYPAIPLLPVQTGNPVIDATNTAINLAIAARNAQLLGPAGTPPELTKGDPTTTLSPVLPPKVAPVGDPVVVQPVYVSDHSTQPVSSVGASPVPVVNTTYTAPSNIPLETVQLRTLNSPLPAGPLWGPGQGPLVADEFHPSQTTPALTPLGSAAFYKPYARYIGDDPNGILVGYVYYATAALQAEGISF